MKIEKLISFTFKIWFILFGKWKFLRNTEKPRWNWIVKQKWFHFSFENHDSSVKQDFPCCSCGFGEREELSEKITQKLSIDTSYKNSSNQQVSSTVNRFCAQSFLCPNNTEIFKILIWHETGPDVSHRSFYEKFCKSNIGKLNINIATANLEIPIAIYWVDVQLKGGLLVLTVSNLMYCLINGITKFPSGL